MIFSAQNPFFYIGMMKVSTPLIYIFYESNLKNMIQAIFIYFSSVTSRFRRCRSHKFAELKFLSSQLDALIIQNFDT
jgi:hypothetical protein